MEIKGSHLEIGYGHRIIIQDIDVTIAQNEITTIIGPNGSGKSTLLKALTQLLPCKSGHIYLDGTDITTINRQQWSRYVGVLPQIHSAPPDFKVIDLVSFGRTPYQKWYQSTTTDDQQVIDWALQATGVWEMRNKSIHSCSGGEAQRVWIATVLAQEPQLLFLDEPTTYLDIAHQQETMRLVKQLKEQSNIGIIMVLHDLNHALEISDKIIVMKDGHKYSEGAPHEVITTTMMKDVYNVDCQIIQLPHRTKPIIVYNQF